MADGAGKGWQLFLSCEHGGHTVPEIYRRRMTAQDLKALVTHRGWDIGALSVAKQLAKVFGCPLHYATISRLLVDLNRSSHHRFCLGPTFRQSDPETKAAIFRSYYYPYRERIEHELCRRARRQPVLHLAIHSFTPVLNGEKRRAAIGLLYDPSRIQERAWVTRIQEGLREQLPTTVVRRNYPYRGRDDGLTKAMRQHLGDRAYAGIELELNQSLLLDRDARLPVVETLAEVLGTFFPRKPHPRS